MGLEIQKRLEFFVRRFRTLVSQPAPSLSQKMQLPKMCEDSIPKRVRFLNGNQKLQIMGIGRLWGLSGSFFLSGSDYQALYTTGGLSLGPSLALQGSEPSTPSRLLPVNGFIAPELPVTTRTIICVHPSFKAPYRHYGSRQTHGFGS